MADERPAARPIDVRERSGVLSPHNLPRFDANWIEPPHGVREVVDAYWSVNWNLNEGETITQAVLEFPAVTVSVESGAVPAPCVVTAVQRRAWSRDISGAGRVFAVRLRPAGLAVLSDLHPVDLHLTQPVTETLDHQLFGFLRGVAAHGTDTDRAAHANALIAEALSRRPPTREHLLANAAVDALTDLVRQRSGQFLAEHLGTSERAVQRALRATLGMGPKAVARRIRLQEVVRRLSNGSTAVAEVAAQLGYVDQAHLINDFRGVSGTTPGAYVRRIEMAAGVR